MKGIRKQIPMLSDSSSYTRDKLRKKKINKEKAERKWRRARGVLRQARVLVLKGGGDSLKECYGKFRKIHQFYNAPPLF